MTARIVSFFTLALVSLWGWGAKPALAQDNVVVVELFTSQGCSACPPADALLGELAGREDVIALALHVDYWDYIGWADTFADPAFTARQHGYSRAAGSTVVYTPQMVVDGFEHVAGYRPMSVADLIRAHSEVTKPVAITVSRADAGFRVEAETDLPQGTAIEVHLVGYLPHAQVDIARGENAGHQTEHYNVVRSWQVVTTWDAAGTFAMQVEPEADLPHVVLFQAAGSGPILGAARLD